MTHLPVASDRRGRLVGDNGMSAVVGTLIASTAVQFGREYPLGPNLLRGALRGLYWGGLVGLFFSGVENFHRHRRGEKEALDALGSVIADTIVTAAAVMVGAIIVTAVSGLGVRGFKIDGKVRFGDLTLGQAAEALGLWAGSVFSGSLGAYFIAAPPQS